MNLNFPLPGEELHRTVTGDTGLRVVASDYYGDDSVVVLVTYPTAPHFAVFIINLETRRGTRQAHRVANIGSAVHLYNQCGGTVNDIDPSYVANAQF